MPFPGAVWPAMGRLELVGRMMSRDSSVMRPETSKTTVRGPEASTAARKLPGPVSFKVVTWMMRPPRPPLARRP